MSDKTLVGVNAGIALFVFVGCTYWTILRFVPTQGTWLRYALPLIPIGLGLVQLAPYLKKK
jgi:hypothetical protein